MAHRQYRESGVTPCSIPDHRHLARILPSDDRDPIRLWDAAPAEGNERLGRLHDENHV